MQFGFCVSIESIICQFNDNNTRGQIKNTFWCKFGCIQINARSKSIDTQFRTTLTCNNIREVHSVNIVDIS